MFTPWILFDTIVKLWLYLARCRAAQGNHEMEEWYGDANQAYSGLKKDEAVIFLKKVEANLDKPSHSIATPKLSQAKKLALQNADLRQK